MRTLTIEEIGFVTGADAGDAAAGGAVVGGTSGAAGAGRLAYMAWGARAGLVMMAGTLGFVVGAIGLGVLAYYAYQQATK